MWSCAAIRAELIVVQDGDVTSLIADARRSFGGLKHRLSGRRGPELRITRAPSVLSSVEDLVSRLTEEHGAENGYLLAQTLIDPSRVFLAREPSPNHLGFTLVRAFDTPSGERLAILECEQVRGNSRDGQPLVNGRGEVLDAGNEEAANAAIAAIYRATDGANGLVDRSCPLVLVFGGERRIMDAGVQSAAAAAGWRGEFFGRPESNFVGAKHAIAKRPVMVAVSSEALSHRPDVVAALQAASEESGANFTLLAGSDPGQAMRSLAAQLATAEITPGLFPDVAAAVSAAKAEFGALDFLAEAESSAEESPFCRPDDVYNGLRHMDTIVRRWRADELPGGFEAAFGELIAGYTADISDTAKTKYAQDYRREVGGEAIMLGPHLKFGRGTPKYCARIYWWVDHAQRRFVVGHVGKHLRDDSW